MPIVPVGSPIQAINAAGTTLTFGKPPGLQNGDYLFACLRSQASAGLSDWELAGFTRTPGPPWPGSSGNSRVFGIYYKRITDAANEPGSYIFATSGSPNRCIGHLITLRGVDPLTPFAGPLVSGGYGGGSITNGRRVFAYLPVPNPATVLFMGANELVAGNDDKPVLKPAGLTELAWGVTSTNTTISRTTSWVGIGEVAGGATPDHDITWVAVAGPAATSVALRAEVRVAATFGNKLTFTATVAPGGAIPTINPIFGHSGRFTAHVTLPPSSLCEGPPMVPPEYPQGIRPIQPQELLTANRTGYFYYELRNRDGSKVGALDGVTPGGTLEFDYTARLKAGGKITIADTGQDIDWLNQRIYIEAHIGDAAWGLGVYLPTAPTERWANGHRGWDVELHSKLLILDQDCISAAYSIPAGTNTIATVKALITSAGEPTGAITDSTATAPASLFWEAGTPKLSIINDLLDASGFFVLQVDGLGNYRALPYVTPAQRPVRYTFQDGLNCIYADAFPRDQDIFSVPNRVIAIQQGSGDQEALVGIVENQDPNSPFSYPARGRFITRVYTGVEATDQTALVTYARRMLVDWSAPSAIVKIEHALVPLAIYDAVQFIYSLGSLNARHVIDKTTVRLDPTALASSTLRQVVTYA